MCLTHHLGRTFSGKKYFRNAFPIVLVIQNKALATQVDGKLCIGCPISNHPTVGQIIRSIHIVGQHGCSGFACGKIVFGETAVNVYGIESDTSAFKHLKHQVMCGPEVLLGITGRSQTILIAHHHQFIIGMLTQEIEGGDDSGQKAELLKAVNLFVRRFFQYGSVTVYK